MKASFPTRKYIAHDKCVESTFYVPYSELHYTQCSTLITRFIFSKIFTKDNPGRAMGCLLWMRSLIHVPLLPLHCCIWYNDILHGVITTLDCTSSLCAYSYKRATHILYVIAQYLAQIQSKVIVEYIKPKGVCCHHNPQGPYGGRRQDTLEWRTLVLQRNVRHIPCSL